MTPEDLAALTARAFPESRARWRTGDFRSFLDTPGAFLATGPHGFAMGRVAADEAELILIATDPDHRRAGHGRNALAAFEAEAHARGARRAYLDVAEGNRAARGLYLSAGYTEVARRPGYYRTSAGRTQTALILEKALIRP
ncbi:MAG: GNAT family N-acetyltransferase [Pseudomonadota bacterium]